MLRLSAPRIVPAAVVALVLTTALAAAVSPSSRAAPTTAPEGELREPPVPEGSLPVTPTEYYLLWAGVSSSDSLTLPAPTTITSTPSLATNLTAASAADGPLTYRDYRRLAADWNSAQWTGFPDTDESTSRYPAGTALSESEFVKAAYADLVTVEPSVVVHTSSGTTTTYVQPSGTIRGLFDYRLAIPATDGRNVSEKDSTVETYQVTEKTIQGPYLIIEYNGQTERVPMTGTLGYTAALGGLPPGSTVDISMVAQFQVKVTKRVEHYECTEVDRSTDPATCEAWEQEETTTTKITDELLVEDSKTVRVADPSPTQKLRYNPRTGEAYLRLSVPPYMTHVTVGDYRILGTYEQYTKQLPAYNLFVKETADGTTEYESRLRLVQTYAVPVRQQPQLDDGARLDDLRLQVEETTTVEGATAAPGVAVSPPSTSHAPQTLTVYIPPAARSGQGGSAPTVQAGTLFSTDHTVSLVDREQYTQATLNATFVEQSDTVRLDVTLTETQSGTPIRTAGRRDLSLVVTRQGTVVRTLNTGRDGTATATFAMESVSAHSLFRVQLEDTAPFKGPSYAAEPVSVTPPRTQSLQSLEGLLPRVLGHPATLLMLGIVAMFKIVDIITPGKWLSLNPKFLIKNR